MILSFVEVHDDWVTTTFLAIAGLLALLRTWFNYNYLLALERKPPIGLNKYFNIDKNVILNYWKIYPLKYNSLEDERATILRKRTNMITIGFYISFVVFIIALYGR